MENEIEPKMNSPETPPGNLPLKYMVLITFHYENSIGLDVLLTVLEGAPWKVSKGNRVVPISFNSI